MSAKKLVYTAVLCAMCTLANIFSVPVTGSNYISFTYLVCFIAAIYLGLVSGLTVAAVGDLLGCIISPKGNFNPLILLSSVLLALIPALIFRIKGLNRNWALAISLLLCLIIVTAGLNTLALWIMFSKGKSFWVYLGGRFPFQCLNTLVNGILLYTLLNTKVIDKLLNKGKFDENDIRD